jgi:Phage phiEco32-like COOH.NH2 ligase-type 2
MSKFLIGADPEIFLRNPFGNLTSAIGLVPGTKEAPADIPGLPRGYMVQHDNVAVEFGIPPAETSEGFVNSINAAMDAISQQILMGMYTYDRASAHSFPEEELRHPAARQFGCDPDFNAWNNGRVNPRPKADDHTLRAAGGHVHVGYELQGKENILRFVQLMDLVLGVPSTLMDTAQARRQLYGKPGAFRVKPYGVEYRTLSNFWIFKPETVAWIYRGVSRTVEMFEAGTDVSAERDLILSSINENNTGATQELMERYAL